MREVSLTYGAMLSGDAGNYFGLWMRRIWTPQVTSSRASESLQPTKFLTARQTGRQPKAMEAFMRVIAVAVVMIAVLALGGLTLRHMPSATAASPEQAKAQVDPHVLPEQNLPGGLFGGPPYP